MINLEGINLFTLPLFREIHLTGQFLDSLLMIYILQKFFGLRKISSISPRTILPVSLPFMVLLAVEDLAMDNNFWGYAALMILFPFTYACIFCRGNALVKAAVCLTIFSLVSTFEDLSVCVTHLVSDGFLISLRIQIPIFIFRRILSKAIVYFIARKLILEMKRLHAEIRKSYWIFLTAACIFNFFLCRYNLLSRGTQISILNLMLSLFSMAVPIVGCYLLRQSISLSQMEKVVGPGYHDSYAEEKSGGKRPDAGCAAELPP